MTTSPDGSPTPARRRRPAGLLGMLVLVALVETFVAARRLDFTTVWADDWRQTAEMAGSAEARKSDVLCFGDSLIKFGVLPRVVRDGSGLKAYNLAVNAGTMPSAYFLLERSIGSGARPKAIVADFFALMLPDEPLKSVRSYPELATLADCWDLARTMGDPAFFSATALGKALPSYRCRFEIRASIVAALDGRRASPWPSQAVIWATWKHQRGAQPMPTVPGRGPNSPELVLGLTPPRWEVDPINAAYFDKFVALAESAEVPIFWVMPPLGPEVQGRRRRSGIDEAYSRFAREAQRHHPGLTVVDARDSGYDDSVHIDAIHLDVKGAEALSKDLAQVIAGHLRDAPSPRWVDLPPYLPPAVAAGPATLDRR